MSMFAKKDYGSEEGETIIGPSVKVKGNFVGKGNVIIEGSVSGSLKTTQDIRIGKESKVKAEIEAANAFVAGEVKGNLKVNGKVELSSSAKVSGDIEARILSIETGAIFNGRSTMVGENIGESKKEEVKDSKK